MESITPLLEKIRPLIKPLTAEERLALIQAIAEIEPSSKPQPGERQAIMKQEQARWYARPWAERAAYQGDYVALHDGQVIDQDPDQRALYLRIKKQHGRDPIPILFADWSQPPTYTIAE